MVRFELKKVFSRFKNKMAVVILCVLMIVVSLLTMNRVYFTDENGNHTSGMQAAKSLREEKNQWRGYVTDKVLKKVLKEREEIYQTKEVLSEENTKEQDKAYAKTQGISSIVEMINTAFSPWRDYDGFAIDRIYPEEAARVYERRISNLKEWLDSGEEYFPEGQKEFLIRQYETLETPFYYEYYEGWSALLQNISTFLLMLALIIGFLVSGIFSDEFVTKADSIFFSTKAGRNRAIVSKIKAGFFIVTGFYVVFVMLYTFIVLFALGMEGAGCPIQWDMWRSVYHVTFFEGYLFIVAGGYVGTLFASALAMIVSAAVHSTAAAVIMPFMVLCAFPFLSRIITLPGMCSFFPDQLLDIYNSLKESVLVEIGGKVMDTAGVILPVYLFASGVLFPVLYLIYKRAEVK